ncbi:hypothetical protein LTR12_016478 [Friedmanniomyces endolithicus]|nr:hypothetical protein LTR74_017971 [Friedmanniomyces endolithicus]KAK1809163.1 hypothetical protein LTR12_016478 [Friedmanniomyces endolithicus]
MPNFLTRFENDTLKIWGEHGIKQAAIWTNLVGPDADNLTHMLAWNSVADRKRKWNAFFAVPEWQEGKAASEKDGPINAKVACSFLSTTKLSAIP